MAHDPSSTPSGEYQPPDPPGQVGWAAERPLVRPRAVTIAAVLWICLGAIVVLGTIGQVANPLFYENLSLGPIIPLFMLGAGVVFIILAVYLLRGSNGARIALTVLGGLLLFGIWTALFIIPALVLQFLSRSSAWFEAVNPRRAPQPGPPGAGQE